MSHTYAPRFYIPNNALASLFLLFLAMVLITTGFAMYVNMPHPQAAATRDMTDDADTIPAADLPPIVDAKPDAA